MKEEFVYVSFVFSGVAEYLGAAETLDSGQLFCANH